jgi:hypothetical protein
MLPVAALAACGTVNDAEPDASCEPTWQDILGNGDFEQGHIVWREDPVDPPSICNRSQLTLATHAGEFAACMGLHDFRIQTLAQDLDLPPGTTRVRLRGYRCLVTSETEAAAYDTLAFTLTDVNDDTATLATLATWSNGDARSACQWAQFEIDAELDAAPERATLRLHSQLDDAKVTSFYLDSLVFEAFACPAARGR